MKKVTTKRQKSRSTLKKNLWAIFTVYIKNRDNWTCVTCGRKATGNGMHGGHFIPKGACGNDYYFDERNVNAQCYHCNHTLEGNRHVYKDYMRRKYGEKALKELESNYRQTNSDYPFESKIEHYKKLVKEQEKFLSTL